MSTMARSSIMSVSLVPNAQIQLETIALYLRMRVVLFVCLATMINLLKNVANAER